MTTTENTTIPTTLAEILTQLGEEIEALYFLAEAIATAEQEEGNVGQARENFFECEALCVTLRAKALEVGGENALENF